MHDSSLRGFRRTSMHCALAVLSVPATAGRANAQQGDLAEGELLYIAQCKICHGSVSATQTSDAVPPNWQLVRLAMHNGGGHTRTDVLVGDDRRRAERHRPRAAAPWEADTAGHNNSLSRRRSGRTCAAFTGGRPVAWRGSSTPRTFLQTLKGMEWNEAALDVWITESTGLGAGRLHVLQATRSGSAPKDHPVLKGATRPNEQAAGRAARPAGRCGQRLIRQPGLPSRRGRDSTGT